MQHFEDERDTKRKKNNGEIAGREQRKNATDWEKEENQNRLTTKNRKDEKKKKKKKKKREYSKDCK